MYNKFILASTLLTISASVIADNEKEVWECKDPNAEWNNILVTAVANKTTGDGVIKVAGIEHHTNFEIAGFDRQWQFGKKLNSDGFKYIFRVKPNGMAHYFNMPDTTNGNTVESEMVLSCRIIGTRWSVNLSNGSQTQNGSTNTEQDVSPCLPGFFIMNIDE